MPHNALITGNSSGLGRGLSEVLLERGYRVYGCSRRGCDLDGDVHDVTCDLTDFKAIPQALETLLADVESLDLVVLNAGVLGEIKDMSETTIDDLKTIMDINVWSNKVILDWLLQSGIKIEQILLMSSGAAVLGNKGWGGYALSKSALNMLGKLYAHEFTESHIAAIAPGLIESSIMDYLCEEADSEQFPALKRIQDARGTDVIMPPKKAAERVLQALPHVKDFESGQFIDIRQILAPEEYAELMNSRHTAGK